MNSQGRDTPLIRSLFCLLPFLSSCCLHPALPPSSLSPSLLFFVFSHFSLHEEMASFLHSCREEVVIRKEGCCVIHGYDTDFILQMASNCLHTCINIDHGQVDTMHSCYLFFASRLLSRLLVSCSYCLALEKCWVTFSFLLVYVLPWLPRHLCPPLTPTPPPSFLFDQFIVLRTGSWPLVHVSFLSGRV